MGLLKSPSELSQNRALSMLIYGQPGVGKTTLALSAPNPVLIDADIGLQRVEKRFQVPSLRLQSYDEVLELMKGNEINSFESIVFDTLGKLVERMGDYLVKMNSKLGQSDGTLSMKGWGALKVEFQSLLRTAQARNKNLIFVAHEREEKDGENKIIRPDVSGSSGKDLVKDLDCMGYMQMRGNKRVISFSPCEKFYAKNSIKLAAEIDIPHTDRGNRFIQEVIIAGTMERMKEDELKNQEYQKLMQSYDTLIEMVADAVTAQEALSHINGTEAIWDSNLQAKKKLNQKITTLGLTYNKETESFEETKAA